MHDVTDDLVAVHEQQIPQSHRSHQSSLGI